MSTDELTDEQLVAAVPNDREAFVGLVNRYEQRLKRYIRRLGIGSEEDAEDLLQDVFIKVYKNLNSFDQRLKFSSWIYRITHNEVVSFFRKKKVRPQGHYIENGEDIIARIRDDMDSSKLAENQLNHDRLVKALDAISLKYKNVIILRYFEEREYEEISNILKIPIGSVGTLLHRAKKALKKHLTNQ